MARITTDSITNVKKGASTASLALYQKSDGQIEFTVVSEDQTLVYASSDRWAKALFAQIDALV